MTLIKVFIAGHKGLVGSALVRRFERDPRYIIITRTHTELDLTQQSYVESFFKIERPDIVVLAAAKVGGLHASYKAGVKKMVFLGSSCV